MAFRHGFDLLSVRGYAGGSIDPRLEFDSSAVFVYRELPIKLIDL